MRIVGPRALARGSRSRGHPLRARPLARSGKPDRPTACPPGPCCRPRRVPASPLSGIPHRRGQRMPQLSVARRLRRGGRGRVSARSRASARPSPRSSASPARARQHADAGHELDPVHPDVRRLHRGLVPRARRLRLLPERRRRRYVVRVGADGAMPTAQAELASGKDKATPAYRVDGRSRPARPATTSRSRSQPSAETAESTFKLVVKQGGKAGRGRSTTSPPRKGKNNVVDRVKAQSKLIRLEEVGSASAVERVPAQGSMTLSGGGRRVPVARHARRLRRQLRRPHRLRRPRGDRRGHDARACPT